MASTITVKSHDTYPPVTAALSDNNGFIDLSTATSVKFIMKGTTVLVTGTAAKLTVGTFTATATLNSPQLTGVSSFTNIVIGSSLIAGGTIPALAVVGSYDPVGATINMVDGSGNPLTALASGAVTVTYNKGTVQYTWAAGDTSAVDTYQNEWEISWPSSGIQTVPNTTTGNATIIIVADLENA